MKFKKGLLTFILAALMLFGIVGMTSTTAKAWDKSSSSHQKCDKWNKSNCNKDKNDKWYVSYFNYTNRGYSYNALYNDVYWNNYYSPYYGYGYNYGSQIRPFWQSPSCVDYGSHVRPFWQ